MESRNHYQPLPRQRGIDTFRLLDLEPGELSDPISCRLRIAELPNGQFSERPVAYEAVSYAWGPESPSFRIHVGAWPVSIRKNLWQFLLQKRHVTEHATLWIDALCIDQSNPSERAYQVQLMDQIYQGAHHALVWLGAADSHSLVAMKTMEEISTEPSSDIPICQSDFESLLAWSRRPYWSRTWVVQEFLLARDILVVCGSARLDWSTILTFIRHVERQLLEGSNTVLNDWQRFKESPAYILMQQRANQSGLRAPLSRLLVQNRYTDCHDPRDKVYAMLGLAAQAESDPEIRVSYTKDLRLLLYEVIDHCQIQAKDLARYVRFLLDLLKIRPDVTPPSSGPELRGKRLSDNNLWTLVGFTTGTVVYSRRLSASSISLPSTCAEGAEGLALRTALRDICPEKLSLMLRELDGVDISKLRSKYGSWDAVTKRRWPSEPSMSNTNRHGGTLRASLVAVFTSGTSKQHLIGMAFGSIQKGDAIIHLPGHPSAIAIRTNPSQIQGPKLTGMLVCAKRDSSERAFDTVTQQPLPFYTIQSETDCVDSVVRYSFQLSPSELLMVAQ